MRVSTLSASAACESIFTPACSASLAGRGVGIGAENFTTLDSGNLLNSKRAAASVEPRGENNGDAFELLPYLMQHYWPETSHSCQGKAKEITVELDA